MQSKSKPKQKWNKLNKIYDDNVLQLQSAVPGRSIRTLSGRLDLARRPGTIRLIEGDRFIQRLSYQKEVLNLFVISPN